MGKKIAISITITILMSLAIGFVFQELFNGFWRATVCGFILHFIVFYIFGTKTPPSNEAEEALNEIIGLQTCPISCPCGNNIFSATIFINNDNVFTCDKCQSKFKVEVSYDSVLVTEPVSIGNVFNSLKSKQ